MLAVISDGLSISQVASKVWVSRQTLHSWLARYEAEGLEGLMDRPHRPVSCPHQMPAEVEAVLLELRRSRPYWGPRRLVFELTKRGVRPVPSESAAYRALVLYMPEVGPPKTKKSIRDISLPSLALEVVDLTAPGFLFTNGAGNPVRAQEFFSGGWKPYRDSATKAGLTKTPRVRDLRHTCGSGMIQAGMPLPVIQQHFGHESI